MRNVVKISAILGLVVAALVVSKKFSDKLTATRTVVHRGILEKIEYTTKHSNMPSYASGTLSSAPVVSDATVVHMQDGTQVVISGKIDVLFAKGMRVAVEEDGLKRRLLVSDVPANASEQTLNL